MNKVFDSNERGFKALELAAMKMNEVAEEMGYEPLYYVGDTWEDYGANMPWTTIIYARNDGFQALYPKEWDDIVNLDFSNLKEMVERQRNILQKRTEESTYDKSAWTEEPTFDPGDFSEDDRGSYVEIYISGLN